MKKVLIAILSLSIVLAVTICSVKTSKVEIIEWAPSEMYTDEEIKDAIDAVCVDLRHFRGVKLQSITYTGDDVSKEYIDWATKYKCDQCLVLVSTVKTSIIVSDFERNKIYENFKWILIRKEGGKWSHVAHEF